jgi:hypothetical protein
MQPITKALAKSLLLTIPIAIGSTITLSPAKAASFAGARGYLLLDNFQSNGNPISANLDTLESITNSKTLTTTDPQNPNSVAEANAEGQADVNADRSEQFSTAIAAGNGLNYSAEGLGTSQSGLDFDPVCGCFQFDFKASLDMIQVADPGETTQAHSFVAFKVYRANDPFTIVDYFKADLWAVNDFQLRVSDADYIKYVLSDTTDGVVQGKEIIGSYHRKFENGTGLTVRGFTTSEATAFNGSATQIPAPPMFAVAILPALNWLKQRSKKRALATSRQSD